ncbi:MAG: radical SAM/SPASM domain-containing protein, partial [Acidobacteriota bacterium]
MTHPLQPFPSRIHIEPTNVCNLDCHFCPYRKQQRRQGYMGLALFQKIVDECREHDPKLWLHFLGEPLLNRDLPRLIAYAKAQGIPQVGLSTNAFFLTRELGEQLIRAGLDRLECSVDGADQATYLRLRRSAEFERVVTNTSEFLRLRRELGAQSPVVTISLMQTPETMASLPNLREFWKSRFDPQDFLMMIQDISFAGTMREPGRTQGREPCKWLWSYVVILWNGDVVTCASDYDGTRAMGNLRDQTLKEIWSSPAYVELRSLHTEARFKEAGIC